MDFEIQVIVAIIAAATLFLIAKVRQRSGSGHARWPYYPKKLLSTPEQILYFRLCKALPEYVVLAQVGLSRILGVKKGHNFGQWHNRINRMSADFVVCQSDSTVVAVIELDDESHQKADRQAADAKKDKALVSAGIRVVRWHVNSLPYEAAIKEVFANAPRGAPANDLAFAQRPQARG
jgi:hypothetical protein